MRPTLGLVGLILLVAPTVLAQGVPERLPDLATITDQPNEPTETGDERPTQETSASTEQEEEENSSTTGGEEPTESVETFQLTGSAPPASSTEPTRSTNGPSSSLEAFHLTGLPTIAGVGIPDIVIPDTSGAPYMQKSNLPDGTVFICVGAALGFFGAAILAWRGLVAWSLHRSVKRAALAQNMADMKAMSHVPGKKRGMYNVVGANSNMSLDRLSAAPPGTSRSMKPFANQANTGTPPKSSHGGGSLFFSPTAGAGGGGGSRDSIAAANRSSNYLPAGYYPTGNAQPASGAPMTHIGGAHGHQTHLSTHSLATPGNRFSARSGISPPGSPSLPPSRGTYDRAPPSRDGLSTLSMYNRNSVATLGTTGGNNTGRGIYGYDANLSQSSLNVPGGTSVAGGRAPSAYLEDLFENHGNGARERY